MSEQMSPPVGPPLGPWIPGANAFTLDVVKPGMANLAAWRQAIDTENQKLSGQLRLTGYQLQTPPQQTDWDFYCVFGTLSHGVAHKDMPYSPETNWVSVGYYAKNMSLVLDLVNPSEKAKLWEAGPSSTVGESTIDFSIGGSLAGGMEGGKPLAVAGIDAGFGASYSAPSVTVAASPVGQLIRWDIKLPGVGFEMPGVPYNPKEPSYSGYTWYYGAIYAIPQDDVFSVWVRPTINWEFDYTRGIDYDDETWSPSGSDTQFTFQPSTSGARSRPRASTSGARSRPRATTSGTRSRRRGTVSR